VGQEQTSKQTPASRAPNVPQPRKQGVRRRRDAKLRETQGGGSPLKHWQSIQVPKGKIVGGDASHSEELPSRKGVSAAHSIQRGKAGEKGSV